MDSNNDQQRQIEIARDKQNDYRTVFSTAEGKRVLSDMLFNLGFMNPVQDERDQVLNNYAIELLTILGIRHSDNLAVIGETLLALPQYNFNEES